jgi:hypothetical protein
MRDLWTRLRHSFRRFFEDLCVTGPMKCPSLIQEAPAASHMLSMLGLDPSTLHFATACVQVVATLPVWKTECLKCPFHRCQCFHQCFLEPAMASGGADETSEFRRPCGKPVTDVEYSRGQLASVLLLSAMLRTFRFEFVPKLDNQEGQREIPVPF